MPHGDPPTADQRRALSRRVLFFCLYLSEGAPIGYIWLALPTRLRVAGVPVPEIAQLTALAVLPWTFKFVWAPLLDLLRGPRWGLRRWVLAAQSVMGLTLMATQGLVLPRDMAALTTLLMVHAVAAATQDVGVDALCISSTTPSERGRLNGWMQAGMLLGRSLMGGGALVMAEWIGHGPVVWLLVVVTTFSMLVLQLSGLEEPPREATRTLRWAQIREAALGALDDRRTWYGLGFAVLGGAGFKSLEVLIGPFLVDHGYSQQEVGWFSALPMIAAMTFGSVAGGVLADRHSRARIAGACLMLLSLTIAVLGALDLATGGARGVALLALLVVVALLIGVFTAASYALFMDLTRPALAAAQYSAFMGATNGCEAWSSYAAGALVAASGYPAALISMATVSLLALPFLARMSAPAGEPS